MQVAEIRAQRIQRENKKNQQQQQANAAVSLTCSIGLNNESKFVNTFLHINLKIGSINLNIGATICEKQP